MKSISHTTVNWTDLIKLTLPIAMGYYAAGIAYGILGVNAGLPAWLVIALSVRHNMARFRCLARQQDFCHW